MKRLAILLAVVVSACGQIEDQQPKSTANEDTGPVSRISILANYQTLTQFEAHCEHKDFELKQLTALQQYKKFDSDPDKLTKEDREFNGYLKGLIWYYSYKCDPL